MLKETWLMVFLSAMMMAAVPCSGFTAKRSVNVPVTGNVMSTFGTEEKITSDHASNTKIEVTNIDKGLPISDTKSTKAVEQMGPADVRREKKFGSTLENVDNEARLGKIKDNNMLKGIETTDSVASLPQNIIMVITEPSQDQENFQKNAKTSHLFTTEGTLQSCNSSQVEGTRFSLDDMLVSGNEMRNHDCEHFLRSNIGSLLLWARAVKGMTTGTLSNANFTIPSSFGYEESVGLSKEFDEIDENNMKPAIPKLKPEIRGDGHVFDLGKPTNKDPLTPLSNSRDEDEAAWKVFDMFSKIRLVLFRSLLESLAAPENPTPSRKSHPLRSNLVDIVEELKSVENEKGFILVASVPASELNSALEILQREASEDTLLVMTGVCSHDNKPVPFFAQGPSATMLREATTIWDVPIVIRNIIANSCQDSNCRIRRHDMFPPSVPAMKTIPNNVGILKRSSRDTAEKMDDTKKVDTPALKKEIKKTDDSNSKKEEAKGQDKDSKLKTARSNSGNFKTAEKFTTVFGTVVSMAVAFTLTL